MLQVQVATTAIQAAITVTVFLIPSNLPRKPYLFICNRIILTFQKNLLYGIEYRITAWLGESTLLDIRIWIKPGLMVSLGPERYHRRISVKNWVRSPLFFQYVENKAVFTPVFLRLILIQAEMRRVTAHAQRRRAAYISVKSQSHFVRSSTT
jgi:hypothetical protein